MARIREAKKEDLEGISDLWVAMCGEVWPWCDPDKEMWAREAKALLAQGNYWLLVAEEDGKFVGFIDGIIMDEAAEGKQAGTCRYIYIAPEYRSAGLLNSLISTLEIIGREHHIDVHYITCDESKRKLWERYGFDAIGLVMRRAL